MSDHAVALVLYFFGKLDAPRLQLSHRLLNIIAIERDIMSARGLTPLGRISRVTAHIRFGQVEYEPAIADIGGRQAKLVTKKIPEFLRLRGVKHSVHAGN